MQAGITSSYSSNWASQVALLVKNLPTGARDRRNAGSFPGLGRSPGKGHGNPLQYSCLKKPIDRRAWQVAVHGIAESDTNEATKHSHMHISISGKDSGYLDQVIVEAVRSQILV